MSAPRSARPPLLPADRGWVLAVLLSTVLPTLLALVAGSAQAAGPQQRRLQVTAELKRQAPITGVETGTGRVTQSVVFAATLATDGTPMPNNPLDPDDGRRQLERSQRQAQRVQAAVAKAPVAAAPSPAAMAELQARAQQMMARCGNDRDCLMREASAMSAAQVAAHAGGAPTQARLQAYGDAVRGCGRRAAAGAAREACIADARRAAGGGDDGPADEAVETPYLHFIGTTRCRLEAQFRLDERVEGRFDDVQGAVPFTQTRQADTRLAGDDTRCPLLQAVLDTRSGRLWTHGPLAIGEPVVVTVRSERGRAPQRHEGPAPLQWAEAQDWLAQRLLSLDAAGGDAVQRQPLPGGGTLELRLRWRFDPA